MARSYEIHELVKLPRLDASGADALVTELLAHAKDKTLPASVESARKALASAHAALKSALTARLSATPATDTARAKSSDQAEDSAFSATFDWLCGFSKLPSTFAEAAIAKGLLDVLFRDGLKFTQLAYKLEWAEADARLTAIANDPSLEQAFTTLGGKIFLDNLRQAHAAYGEALGITDPKEAAQAAVPVKEPLDALKEAIRTYALRVLAHDDDASAETLLAPLTTWESRARSSKTAAAPAPSAPAAAPANT